ncbi:MAG: hypothetical protein LC687_07175, partial [Actinobacteria bacterium]|nr:hypothetical protein [Actinomycetota bacterium]
MKKSIKLMICATLSILMLTVGLSLAMNHGGSHTGHGNSTPAKSGHDAHQMKATSESGHGGG